ncbi:hypothetical protein [Streptomyces thioluteus]|uniref:hypothetical protein n=1 Tax=Streptomyces thioluteus TaxID=66431 RepID=UPI0031E812A7
MVCPSAANLPGTDALLAGEDVHPRARLGDDSRTPPRGEGAGRRLPPTCPRAPGAVVRLPCTTAAMYGAG